MPPHKKALITGVAGQDGSYLAELLLSKGYQVFGLAHVGSRTDYVPPEVDLTFGELTDQVCVEALVKRSIPDEVYNLASITDLKIAFEHPELTFKINYEAVGFLLNTTFKINPQARFLQASSSEVFELSPTSLNEDSLRCWDTANPYAKAKMMADRDFILHAREHDGNFACSALLFNHESPRCRESRALKKITRTLVDIVRGHQTSLNLGNLAALRDWGFAPDYVRALWQMLQVDSPEDLVLATGKTHSIEEAIILSAGLLGLSLVWHGEGPERYACDTSGIQRVLVAPDFYRPAEHYPRVGDIRKAKETINWEPSIDFSSLIKLMTEASLQRA
ncbi:MAG: GDP-mannose 4,6-dehydratase [Candidatus Roizmanbacteria bacterium]|nr:GDP-mannose 4,6-dehydratase [Candidatus Roizmanbacteria bacterium]